MLSPRQRCLSAACTAALLVVAVLIGIRPRLAERSSAAPKPAPPRSWPLFGGTPERNMVNTVDREIPATWDVHTGKNIKWKATLGTRAFGGPVVTGGKIFCGTNNERPRDPKIKGDRGILILQR